MDLLRFLLELIDLRSFSNLWYWIGLAVLWSCLSYWVLGVPYDLITKAERQGGAALADLETALGIQVRRLLDTVERAGLLLTVTMSCALTMLFLLGFVYRVEFCQAVFLMLFPAVLILLWNLHTARRIAAGDIAAQELPGLLLRKRMGIQLLGVMFILVTTLWGMYQNIAIGILI